MKTADLMVAPSKCSGCGACMVVCPKSAIKMVPDPCGYLYPQIDETICVDCGICKKMCPHQNSVPKGEPREAYAAVSQCSDLSAKSASGGVFATLASACMEEGALVAGAVMDLAEEVDVYHLLSDSPEGIRRMQGSKYVQSDAQRCYRDVMESLKAGKTVLFSGTPCQVAAVKKITGDPENLITVDLICHGVPSLQMFDSWMKILEKRFKGRCRGFSFRDKSCIKQFCASFDIERKKGISRYALKSHFLSYYKYFLEGSIYRESCYHCPYAQSHRISNLTIGDYWGIETHHKEELRSGAMAHRNDWSCILVNDAKGAAFLGKYAERLYLIPSRTEWIAQKNEQLNHPSEKPASREAVLHSYRQYGYPGVEKLFIQKAGGTLRFCWRMGKNLYQNKKIISRTQGKDSEK